MSKKPAKSFTSRWKKVIKSLPRGKRPAVIATDAKMRPDLRDHAWKAAIDADWAADYDELSTDRMYGIVDAILTELRRHGAWLPGDLVTTRMCEAAAQKWYRGYKPEECDPGVHQDMLDEVQRMVSAALAEIRT